MKKIWILSLIIGIIAAVVVVKNMKQNNISSDRIKIFHTVSDRLNALSDEDLQKLLVQGAKIESSWGEAQQINIDGTIVFVKQVALTDLEKLPENMRSTKNLFDLPLYYQYGVGSAGFGVWRELASHIMTTQWVLSGACPNFPLLYHWRIVPAQKREPMSAEALKSLEESVTYWGGSPAIRRRLEALHNASSKIALFLEYIPYQLESWMRNEFAKGVSAAESASRMILTNLEEVCAFMQSHDFVHFDAHFENILTDGHRLYLADFGLALSSEFELSTAERDFLKLHHNYDTYYTITYLVDAMTAILFGKGNQGSVLREYASGQGNRTLSPFLQETLTHYAPLALEMNEFRHMLRTVSKTTPYPASKLDALYNENSIAKKKSSTNHAEDNQ
jgi:serine/threonine protein kinase